MTSLPNKLLCQCHILYWMIFTIPTYKGSSDKFRPFDALIINLELFSSYLEQGRPCWKPLMAYASHHYVTIFSSTIPYNSKVNLRTSTTVSSTYGPVWTNQHSTTGVGTCCSSVRPLQYVYTLSHICKRDCLHLPKCFLRWSGGWKI